MTKSFVDNKTPTFLSNHIKGHQPIFSPTVTTKLFIRMVLPIVLLLLSPAVTGFDVAGFLKSCTKTDEELLCSNFEFDRYDEAAIRGSTFNISDASVIKFHNSRIGVFNENLVNKFPSATEITIFNCQLSLRKNITSISAENTVLEKLTIDMSYIFENEETIAFTKLIGLKELVISNPHYIEYQNIDDSMLEANVNLETIVFDRMQLISLGPNSFASQQLLRNLTVINNFIPFVPGGLLDQNLDLEIVDLSRNGIVDLPLEFFPDSIKSISFNNNGVQAISDRHFKGLVELEYLNLSFNRIGVFSLLAIADSGKLKVLNLQSNEITSFEKEHFGNNTQLEEVNISSNRFTSLPNDVFDGLEKLKNIQIFE